MTYYSLNKKTPDVSFKEAAIQGQAPDKGLYFPSMIPKLDPNLIKNISSFSNEQIAFDVIKPFIGNSIPDDKLQSIVRETINFQIPLVPVGENIFSLELFHGPTLAFKDVGARFMSRCLGYFIEQGIEGVKNSGKVTVLVATSGDTGGAVANGFYDVPGIDVVILYPSGKVSPVQEQQLTSLGKNIHALEVQGSFDDCQAMVKQAFIDKDINEKLFLTSANSINVARWLPQQFYYFSAYKQWPDKSIDPVFSVPSGNFGNICAGMLARQTGLPVRHFIAACNSNDVVKRFLNTNLYEPTKAVGTLSNAMDVGDPSNFIRILELFDHHYPDLKSSLSAERITDEETIETIKSVYEEYNYMLDPHGAVGYLSLQRYLKSRAGESGIFLETAHPVKFPAAVQMATGKEIDVPRSISKLSSVKKSSHLIPNEYKFVKDFLLAN